jgi:adenylosuccinate lyase
MDELNAMITDYNAFTGRAEAQTREYLHEVVAPLLVRHRDLIGSFDASLKV